MLRLIAALIVVGLLAGCTAGSVKMMAESMQVQVGANPPGQGYIQIGPITAKHGGGCGLYGSQGDYEGAMNILRNKAAELHADYVQIVRQEGEHMAGLCLDRAYVIDGFAYRRVKGQ